eukprot:scaffold1277_cov253-Pinguiococcus_pyrenoidosus.AAC.40
MASATLKEDAVGNLVSSELPLKPRTGTFTRQTRGHRRRQNTRRQFEQRSAIDWGERGPGSGAVRPLRHSGREGVVVLVRKVARCFDVKRASFLQGFDGLGIDRLDVNEASEIKAELLAAECEAQRQKRSRCSHAHHHPGGDRSKPKPLEEADAHAAASRQALHFQALAPIRGRDRELPRWHVLHGAHKVDILLLHDDALHRFDALRDGRHGRLHALLQKVQLRLELLENTPLLLLDGKRVGARCALLDFHQIPLEREHPGENLLDLSGHNDIHAGDAFLRLALQLRQDIPDRRLDAFLQRSQSLKDQLPARVDLGLDFGNHVLARGEEPLLDEAELVVLVHPQGPDLRVGHEAIQLLGGLPDPVLAVLVGVPQHSREALARCGRIDLEDVDELGENSVQKGVRCGAHLRIQLLDDDPVGPVNDPVAIPSRLQGIRSVHGRSIRLAVVEDQPEGHGSVGQLPPLVALLQKQVERHQRRVPDFLRVRVTLLELLEQVGDGRFVLEGVCQALPGLLGPLLLHVRLLRRMRSGRADVHLLRRGLALVPILADVVEPEDQISDRVALSALAGSELSVRGARLVHVFPRVPVAASVLVLEVQLQIADNDARETAPQHFSQRLKHPAPHHQ